MRNSNNHRLQTPGAERASESCPAPLLLKASEAAEVLRISERSLWSLTAPRGSIRPVKIGSSIRYAVCELRRWIDDQLEESAPHSAPPAGENRSDPQ